MGIPYHSLSDNADAWPHVNLARRVWRVIVEKAPHASQEALPVWIRQSSRVEPHRASQSLSGPLGFFRESEPVGLSGYRHDRHDGRGVCVRSRETLGTHTLAAPTPTLNSLAGISP
jgi:hypothetical protein